MSGTRRGRAVAIPAGMRNAFACLLVVALGCGDEATPADPMVCHDIGYTSSTLKRDVDLLLLVGNASSMVEVQAALADQIHRLVAELEVQEGGLPDVHIAVMSDDGAALLVPDACPSMTDGERFIVDRLVDPESGTRELNYTGLLDQQLACMVEVGTAGGEVERPLASLARALEDEDSGFRRPGAGLAVAIVSDGDDGSPGEVAAYVDRIAAVVAPPASMDVRVVSGGAEGCTLDGFTDAAPAPRLAAFAAAFGEDGAAVSLCGEEPLLGGLAAALDRFSIGACLPDPPGSADDCQVLRFTDDLEVPLPSCDDAAPPCYRLTADARSCPDSDQHLHVSVDSGGAPLSGGFVSASCAPECP